MVQQAIGLLQALQAWKENWETKSYSIFPPQKEHTNFLKIALVNLSHWKTSNQSYIYVPCKIAYTGTQSCPNHHFFGGLWSCTACPLSSSPKHQWKMLDKVISPFRLEADSHPGLVPITKVNEKHWRKFPAIKYTHTHSWKRQIDLSACLYQFSSSKENQARLSINSWTPDSETLCKNCSVHPMSMDMLGKKKISAHGSDTHSLAFPGGTSCMPRQSQW